MEVVLTFEPPLSTQEAAELRALLSHVGDVNPRSEQWVLRLTRPAADITAQIQQRFGTAHICHCHSRLTVK